MKGLALLVLSVVVFTAQAQHNTLTVKEKKEGWLGTEVLN
jgi:hypothetical protein